MNVDVPYSADLAYVHDRGYGFHGTATAPGVLALIEPLRGRVVHEFGAGTGALTAHLVAAGHRVVASDASPAMITLLRRNVPDADVLQLRLPSDPVPPADAVVGVGHALNYLPDVDSVRRGVLAVGASLRPGGVLAFDLCDVAYGEGREAPFALVGDDWTIVTRFSRPSPERFVRDVTTFVREQDGRWRRGDERQVSTLVDTTQVPGWLAEVGVRARVLPAFGNETLPSGLVTVVGARS